ncbi:nicotinate (nicotinamide) nucleotide adenylyltransferase [Sulfurimonas sp. MAG313]|nr:nicotinate (nicotinamide) nucleotide adenylyltransferase [Sulfurimonas sp. MAG313]MDF1880409.1 nicotinate (nicotinamide) nucleotide adenylyltransferase [Sulfurimonas sp. MAG313]
MRKAIFGGSFDPPHIGHLEIIQQTIISLNIDKLLVVPAFLNPFKSKNVAPSHLRLKWLKEMTKGMPKVEVSSFEIDLSLPVSSIRTVKHFQDEDETYFIIGADNLEKLSLWQDFEELDTLVTWVVATRDDIKIPEKYEILKVNQNISATQLRQGVDEAYLDKEIALEVLSFYKKSIK